MGIFPDVSLCSPFPATLAGCFLTQVVPDIHLATQGPNFNDGLAKEIIGLSLEPLLYSGLDVIILIPHTHLNAVRGIVALTAREVGELLGTE